MHLILPGWRRELLFTKHTPQHCPIRSSISSNTSPCSPLSSNYVLSFSLFPFFLPEKQMHTDTDSHPDTSKKCARLYHPLRLYEKHTHTHTNLPVCLLLFCSPFHPSANHFIFLIEIVVYIHIDTHTDSTNNQKCVFSVAFSLLSSSSPCWLSPMVLTCVRYVRSARGRSSSSLPSFVNDIFKYTDILHLHTHIHTHFHSYKRRTTTSRALKANAAPQAWTSTRPQPSHPPLQ